MAQTSEATVTKQKQELSEIVQALEYDDRAVLVVVKADGETLILKDHHAGDLYDIMGLLQGGIQYAQHDLQLRNDE